MKSYTDIEQSKMLTEILPIESADMCCFQNPNGDINYYGFPFLQGNKTSNPIPCWSVGALISLLPKHYCLETLDNGTYACYNFLSQYEKFGKTPIDAVYSMIVFLKEEKII